MQRNEVYDGRSDEFTFFDLLNLLIKRRWIIIVITLFFLLMGLLYTLLSKKIYGCNVVIAMARIVPVGAPDAPLFVTPPEVLAHKLMSRQRIVNHERVAWVSDANVLSVGTERSNLIRVDVHGGSTKSAEKFAANIAKDLLSSQNAIIERRKSHLESYLGQLIADLKSTESLLTQARGKMTPEERDVRARLIAAKVKIQANMEMTRRELSTAHLNAAEILSGPTSSAEPVLPKTKIILIATLFLGLLFGVVSALFVEFLAAAKREFANQ